MDPQNHPGIVEEETIAFEDRDSHTRKRADREPTPDEERAAEQNDLDPAVAAAYEEAIERGAAVEGEGQI